MKDLVKRQMTFGVKLATEVDLMKYKVGDSVWVICADCFILRCKIIHLDTFNGFYWLDEPFGHSLAEDELFPTKEDALVFVNEESRTYEEWRQDNINFIAKTHKDADLTPEKFPHQNPKEHSKDWFFFTEI